MSERDRTVSKPFLQPVTAQAGGGGQLLRFAGKKYGSLV